MENERVKMVEDMENVEEGNPLPNISLYMVSLEGVFAEIRGLPNPISQERVIRELCTRSYNGVQSYMIEDVKAALNGGLLRPYRT